MAEPNAVDRPTRKFQTKSVLTGALGGIALTALGLAAFGPQATAQGRHWIAAFYEAALDAAPQPAETASKRLTAMALPEFTDPIDAEAIALAMAPATVAHTVSVAPGDTLMDLMVRAGADRGDAYQAINAMRSHYNPRRLRPGQEITLVFRAAEADGQPGPLETVDLTADVDRRVVVARSDDGYVAEEIARPLTPRPQRAAGRIDDSLYLAATRSLVPDPVVIELIRLYSFDIDFQRDIQPGDGFELFYEGMADETGAVVKQGPILFARLDVGAKSLPLYRFETDDGDVDYYNAKGESVRKALLRTPIDGARLSSRFGMRKHPVLGYSKMHRGLDFAAPSGTPIMAAGNGTIEFAGRNGSYGKYVRIRHSGEYKTAYAHMSKLGRGIGKGKRVQQGDIIGYVGTTGRSTGPHLHYEVLAKDRQVNPLGIKLPTGRTLAGTELAAFQKMRRALDQRIEQLPLATQVAQQADD